MINAIIIYY